MTRDPSTWFRESVSEDLYQEAKISGIVYSGQSPYQTIEIIDTLPFGRTLVLDGKTQSSETDEFIYHEMLVHPAMITQPQPRARLHRRRRRRAPPSGTSSPTRASSRPSWSTSTRR